MTAVLARDGYAAVPTTPRQNFVLTHENSCHHVDIAFPGTPAKPQETQQHVTAPAPGARPALPEQKPKVTEYNIACHAKCTGIATTVPSHHHQ